MIPCAWNFTVGLFGAKCLFYGGEDHLRRRSSSPPYPPLLGCFLVWVEIYQMGRRFCLKQTCCGSVWCKGLLSRAMTLCRKTHSGFVLYKLTPSWGQNHLRRRSSSPPRLLSLWLLPCLGEDLSNEKMFLFEVHRQAWNFCKFCGC